MSEVKERLIKEFGEGILNETAYYIDFYKNKVMYEVFWNGHRVVFEYDLEYRDSIDTQQDVKMIVEYQDDWRYTTRKLTKKQLGELVEKYQKEIESVHKKYAFLGK